MAGPMMMMPLNNVRRRNQEVPLIFTRALQWKHTTVAVQMTLALTGTHSNALLTISLLTNRYIFTVHLQGRSQYEANRGTSLSHFFRFFFRSTVNTTNTTDK